ncbi:MAG: hypothetical protein KDD76_03110, partial [Rickettsiales bacterium]|nr:hypothetical protein [Rickettsiales bacterium]
MADLLNEIKEDIRHDRRVQLVPRLMKYGVIGLVIVLVIVGGVKWFRHTQQTNAEDSLANLQTTLETIEEDKADETALNKLDNLYKTGKGGARYLAGLKRAGLLASQNKVTDAIQLYHDIAEQRSTPEEFRDLARLMEVFFTIQSNPDADSNTLQTHLKALSANGRPWRYNAMELQASY